ncbi:MAG TPA: hypothetical protein VNZ53_07530 [Steroidobacteraceae bacterium]|jgi:enoyl-CoA hydratase/carnithine racemase|nr:hypothetical protein [Steroidobacteraceae bacterium]
MPSPSETLGMRQEGAVLFVSINAPPMNLLGPELVRDLVSLIQQAEADAAVQVLVFKSADPEYFISHVDVTRIKEYRHYDAELAERYGWINGRYRPRLSVTSSARSLIG